MPTLGDMKSRIADELARTDLATQTGQAIDSAIRYYERRRFWFNEARVTIPTVVGAEFYSPAMTQIDGIARAGSWGWTLREVTPEWIDAMQSGTDTGEPTDWAWFANQLRVYPIPSAVVSLVALGTAVLPALSSDTASNAWTTEAEDLIRARAKAYLYTNVIREDGTDATFAKGEEQEALRSLMSQTARRSGVGVVRASYL